MRATLMNPPGKGRVISVIAHFNRQDFPLYDNLLGKAQGELRTLTKTKVSITERWWGWCDYLIWTVECTPKQVIKVARMWPSVADNLPESYKLIMCRSVADELDGAYA